MIIKWTSHDVKRMAEYVLGRRNVDKETSLCKLVRESQKNVVPHERHKTMSSLQHAVPVVLELKKSLPELADWKPYVHASVKAKAKVTKVVKAASPVVLVPPVVAAGPVKVATDGLIPNGSEVHSGQEQNLVVIVSREEKPPVTPIEAATQLSTGQLIGILVDRYLQGQANQKAIPETLQPVAQAVSRVVAPLVSSPALQPKASPSQPEQSARARKKEIAIVGFLAEQFQDFRAKAPKDATYIYVSKDDERIPRTDGALIHRHASHRIWDEARRLLGKNNVEFVTGGVSQMVQRAWDLKAQGKLAEVCVA